MDTTDLSRVIELQFPSIWSWNNNDMLLQSFGMSCNYGTEITTGPLHLFHLPTAYRESILKHRDPFLGASEYIPASALPGFLPGFLIHCHFQKSFTLIFQFQVQLPSSQVSLAIQGAKKDRLQPFPLPPPGEEGFDSHAQQHGITQAGKNPLKPTSPIIPPALPSLPLPRPQVPHAHGLSTLARMMNPLLP